MSNHILFYWVMRESKPRSYSGILQSPLTFKPYSLCISLLSLLTGSAIEFRLFFRLKSNLNWNLLPSFANLPSLCDVRFTHRTQRDSASTVASLRKWKFSERINPSFLGSKLILPPSSGFTLHKNPDFDYPPDRKPKLDRKYYMGLNTLTVRH